MLITILSSFKRKMFFIIKNFDDQNVNFLMINLGVNYLFRFCEAASEALWISTATMVTNLPATKSTNTTTSLQEKRHRSIFEVPPNFFDCCRLLPSPHSSVSDHYSVSRTQTLEPSSNDDVVLDAPQNAVVSAPRWTCNTCKTQFDSLQDQRSHFKSDIHRFNVIFNHSRTVLFSVNFRKI